MIYLSLRRLLRDRVRYTALTVQASTRAISDKYCRIKESQNIFVRQVLPRSSGPTHKQMHKSHHYNCKLFFELVLYHEQACPVSEGSNKYVAQKYFLPSVVALFLSSTHDSLLNLFQLSFITHHSSGTAKSNGLSFVLILPHFSAAFDTIFHSLLLEMISSLVLLVSIFPAFPLNSLVCLPQSCILPFPLPSSTQFLNEPIGSVTWPCSLKWHHLVSWLQVVQTSFKKNKSDDFNQH